TGGYRSAPRRQLRPHPVPEPRPPQRRVRMKFPRPAWLVAMALMAAPVHAQVMHPHMPDPEPWKEAEVPAPSQWSVERAVEFQLGAQGSLRYAIDPQTVSIGEDGVVRYVFIAHSSSGAVNAFFEGMRCQTAEVKVYARWDPDTRQWRTSGSEPWQALDVRGATRRAMQMARAGVCDGKSPNRSPSQIVSALRNGRADQFR
ncbi:MAG: CNP1-like family protein, partial [Hydrogenophaga sp.]|nr:CNP1-like family protein [Hydrogenophaga sp.]